MLSEVGRRANIIQCLICDSEAYPTSVDIVSARIHFRCGKGIHTFSLEYVLRQELHSYFRDYGLNYQEMEAKVD